MHVAIELNEHYTQRLLQLQQQLHRPLPEIVTHLVEQALEANGLPTDSRPLLDVEQTSADHIAQQATIVLRPAVAAAFNDSLDEFDSLYRELAK